MELRRGCVVTLLIVLTVTSNSILSYSQQATFLSSVNKAVSYIHAGVPPRTERTSGYDEDGILWIVSGFGGFAEQAVDENARIGYALTIGIENSFRLSYVESNKRSIREHIIKLAQTLYRIKSLDRTGWSDKPAGATVYSDVTAHCVRFLSAAVRNGIVDYDDRFDRAVRDLVSLRDQTGGWSISPNSRLPAEKKPLPGVTAEVLVALLDAKKVNGPVGNDIIQSAINFIVQKAVKSGDKVYWESESKYRSGWDKMAVTSMALYSLCLAKAQGYQVSDEIIQGALSWIVYNLINIARPMDAIFPGMALIQTTFLGYMESEELKGLLMDSMTSLAFSQLPNGAFTNTGYAHIDVIPPTHVIPLFLDWATVTSISTSQISVLSEYIDESYTPIRLVAGGDATFTMTVNSEAEYPLNIRCYTEKPDFLAVLSESGREAYLNPGDTHTYSISLKSPETASLQTVELTFIVVMLVDDREMPIQTRKFKFEIARNSEIQITKTVSPQTVKLEGLVSVSIMLKNNGDMDAKNIMIREELGEGIYVADYMNTSVSLFTTGISITTMKPGEYITFTYTAKPGEAGPGEITLATTFVTYSDALKRLRNVSKASNIVVQRPKLTVSVILPEEVNQSQILIEWAETKTVRVKISNDGNQQAVNASINVNIPKELKIEDPGNLSVSGSRLIYTISQLNPGKTVELAFKVKAGYIYTLPRITTSIKTEYSYEDAEGRALTGYSGSTHLTLYVVVSTWFKILIIAIVIVVAGLIVIRIGKRVGSSMRKRRVSIGIRWGRARLG